MITTTPPEPMVLTPNHHAHHPGFSGIGGLAAAVTFSVGRRPAADVAVQLAGVGRGDDVVDVGCGPGVAVRRAAAAGAASVVGIDPATVMLRVGRILSRLRIGGSAAVRYLEGTAEALPLPDDSAGVVWSLSTVHHWRDLELGLAEARRVLRTSGRLLAIERHVAPGASGHAGHGWTNEQAELFADHCRAAGFTDLDIGEQRAGDRPVLWVLGRNA
jgi:ubiquinone/menaquinone biosynthesis C-methylase UbiE